MKNVSLVDELKKSKSFTKTEQHLLIYMRLVGKVNGWKSQSDYVFSSARFYKGIKTLMKMGLVNKKQKIEGGKFKSEYTLTRKGLSFNADLMKHPEYIQIWNNMKKGRSFG